MFSKSLNANYPLKFIRLNPTNGVNSFNCGDVDLDDFILNRASNFQQKTPKLTELWRFFEI